MDVTAVRHKTSGSGGWGWTLGAGWPCGLWGVDGVADPSPRLLFKRFYIDAELQSLVRWALVVDAIQVEGPHLSVTRLDVAGHYDVDDMRELALQRGLAVRDYRASQKFPSERLFLGAAKAVPPEAKWSPRAELNLSTR